MRSQALTPPDGVQETAAAAPSCEEGFAEVADSVGTWLRGLVACLVWLLVIVELGVVAGLTGAAVFISPLLPVCTRRHELA